MNGEKFSLKVNALVQSSERKTRSECMYYSHQYAIGSFDKVILVFFFPQAVETQMCLTGVRFDFLLFVRVPLRVKAIHFCELIG